jgi:hypothetical protein
MAESGLLRERIRIERHDTATDTWLPLASMPEVNAAVEALGDERYRVQTHYRDDLAGMQDAQPALRIVYRGRVLEVLLIREVGWRESLELDAQANRVLVDDLGSSARQTTQWPQP